MSADRVGLVNSFRQMFASDESIEIPRLAVDLEDALALIKNQRRRLVLQYLAETGDGEIQIGELAERIAAVENGVDVDEVMSDQRKRVYVGLYQCHIPELVDMGAVTWNRGTLGTTPATEDWTEWVFALEAATGGEDQ